MIDKELVLDNIQGAIECIDCLRDELRSVDINWKNDDNNYNHTLDSLINGNIILLKQTKSYLREELK